MDSPLSPSISEKPPRRICARCASIKQACDNGVPCGRCSRLSLPCVDRGEEDVISRPPKIRRVHTGCEACKRRKRKCDETKPRCRSCVKLCLACVWPQKWRTSHPSSTTPDTQTAETWSPMSAEFEDVSTPWTLSTPSDTASTPDCTALILGTSPKTAPELDSRAEKDLLGHFINVTASHLVRASSSSTNSYLRYLLPMAFFDRSVMDAILALSASQQQSRKITSSQTTLHYQSQAAKRLRRLLSSTEPASSAVALATSLVLCMTELYAGSTDGWKQHLCGAKQITDLLNTGSKSHSDELRFLMSMYCFLDSATTISTCRPPLAERFKDDEPSDQDSLQIYGIPQSLFHLLDRVNSLAYQRRTRIDDDSERAFRHSARSVADAIDLHIDFAEIFNDEEATDMSHASSAFKWAMRLRLAQIVEGYDATNADIVNALNHILQEVEKVPTSSPSQATLLFPLIMAAGACILEEDRETIRQRLSTMQAQTGFGHIYAAQELAERVWLYRDLDLFSPSSTPVNWAHVRYYEMHGLAVF